MATYLITGRSGTGKSTICHRLQQLGLPAFDGDEVPGLARWIDVRSGHPIKMDYSNPVIDRKRFHWEWDKTVLMSLLNSHENIFVCGSADNQLELHGLFDRVYALALPPDEQRRRILARTSHDYGKHPEMQDQILLEQQEFITQAVAQGAIAIDATPNVEAIVLNILNKARL